MLTEMKSLRLAMDFICSILSASDLANKNVAA